MKLIIVGATGFVGRELVRQSLNRSEITSIVAISRKPVPVFEGVDRSKLINVLVDDYGLLEQAKKEFAGAAACIWTIGITPTRSKMYDFEEVKRVCRTCTLDGMRTMHESGVLKPFRFLYTSAGGIKRAPETNNIVKYYADYIRLRSEIETDVLALAAELEIDACVAKPGSITKRGDILRTVMGFLTDWLLGVRRMSVEDLATAMLDQVINGFEKEPLTPEDLIRIARNGQKSSSTVNT